MTTKQMAIYLARKLRKNQTKAEMVFWQAVRNKKFMNYKFLRQYPIFYIYEKKEKFFITDFYCNSLKLFIEVDGGIHNQQKDYDKIRSELLSIQHDLRIIRFTNDEIIEDINKVLLTLRKFISHK